MSEDLKTLNDFQKLLGDINCVQPSLGILNSDLSNLYLTFEGEPALNSPRQLTPEAQKEFLGLFNGPAPKVPSFQIYLEKRCGYCSLLHPIPQLLLQLSYLAH